MRIIAGEAKGKPLKSIPGKATRPTSDRVKESVFSIIQPLLIDSRILDLFAGTGSLGFEALSRGADKVIFVENSREAIKVIKENSGALGYGNMIQIIKKDAVRALTELAKHGILFDIIFMDPPYGKGYEELVLAKISQAELLHNNGIIVVEHEATLLPPNRVETLYCFDRRKYGGTGISFYRKE